VATLADLADYFRQRPTDVRGIVAELVADGELDTVQVAGWNEQAFLVRGAKIPAHNPAQALLSPFDSLIWFRPRTERLFNFHYRIEIYTPEARRQFGYYELPFMMDGNIEARVDLKSDRVSGRLRVQGAFGERGVDAHVVADRLAGELSEMALWLGLDEVHVGRRGNFAAAVSGAVAAMRR
jgi:uncharacterized protein YcaQ